MKILQQIKKNFFDIRREEWPTALLMSLYFFMVIATFWILKPMKRGLLVNYYQASPLQFLGTTFTGAEVEQLAKVLNMIVVYLIVIGFTWLSRKLHRQKLNVVICSLYSLLFVIYGMMIHNTTAEVAWSFYVLGDMFNSTLVVFFWAFANDIFQSDQAKRSYGIVGLGGIIGGIVGSSLVVGFVESLGREALLYICVIPMAVLVVIGYLVNQREKIDDAEKQDPCAEGKKCNAIYEGAMLVFRSKYLLAIVGIIGLYEMVSNIVDFQLSAIIQMQIAGELEKDAYFGFVGQLTSILSLLVQLFLTSFIMKKYSVKIALLFLPIAITLGSIGFLVLPSILFVTVMSVSDNSLNYSINQSAKEALYTPTSRDEKYKAKSFIDMFVQRAAKVLAVVLNLAVAAYVGLEHIRWLSVASLLILAGWIAIVQFAGKEFRDKASVEEIPV